MSEERTPYLGKTPENTTRIDEDERKELLTGSGVLSSLSTSVFDVEV